MNKEPEIPKSEWGPGPWQNEPDRMEWKYKGFPCLMVRVMEVTGSWCGYVAVPPGHPAFEKNYEDVDVNVHGGLTYGDHCQGHICHKPEPGEPDNVYWLGFDCAHGFDLMPRMDALMRKLTGHPSSFEGIYRDVAYVKKEVESLADQLAAMEKIASSPLQ